MENKGFPLSEFSEGPLEFFIFAVTILVRAAPALHPHIPGAAYMQIKRAWPSFEHVTHVADTL